MTSASLPEQPRSTGDGGFRPRQVASVEAYPASPWASGSGSTRVIAVAPGPTPAWRISVATVDDGAEFSHLPGIRRLHLPLQAGGTVLSSRGRPLAISPDGAVRFDGGADVSAHVPGGRALALNVMTTAEGPDVELRFASVTGSFTSRDPHTVCVIVRSGSVFTDVGRAISAAVVVPAGVQIEAVDAELVEIALV